MRFSIFIVIIFLFELISCSSTKYHTLKEVLVKVNKANYNQEPNVYIFDSGDSIKRGPWSSCKLNEGNIIDEVEDAVVLQTIGKIQWKYPLWWAASGFDRYPDVNKAKTKELDIGIKYSSSLGDYLNEKQVISNALIVNSHAEPDGKILYQNGLIPVGNTSYWGIYPSKIIEHKDRWIDHFEFIPEKSFFGKEV